MYIHIITENIFCLPQEPYPPELVVPGDEAVPFALQAFYRLLLIIIDE